MIRCVVCGSTRVYKNFSEHLARCRECGHAWQKDFVHRKYGKTYLSRKYPAAAPTTKLLLAARAGLVLSRAKDHVAVFDFGAGDLKFVRALSAYGIPCTYFLTAEIKTDEKELKKNLRGKGVLMTAFDVFEHLPAPEKVIKEYAP